MTEPSVPRGMDRAEERPARQEARAIENFMVMMMGDVLIRESKIKSWTVGVDGLDLVW